MAYFSPTPFFFVGGGGCFIIATYAIFRLRKGKVSRVSNIGAVQDWCRARLEYHAISSICVFTRTLTVMSECLLLRQMDRKESLIASGILAGLDSLVLTIFGRVLHPFIQTKKTTVCADSDR